MRYMHIILVLIRVYHTIGIKYRGFMLSIRSHVRRVIVRRMPATLIVAWLVNSISNIMYIRYSNGSNFVTWSKNTQHAAFRELKKRLTSTPVLLFPDFDLGFTIQTDSSGYAIGGVLLQDQGNGLQPIAYESRKMIPAETRYPVHEQELLAILFCCKKWRHYILNNRTNITTDHAPLKHLQTQPHLSARQARWLDFLAQYDLNIVPQPGKLNTVADALSRRCDYVNPQLWHIYHKSNVFSVQVITSRELSSRVNETFYVDDDIEAITSQLNVMSVLTIESSISEKQILQAVAKLLKSDPFVQKLYSQKEKTILTAHGKYILLNDIVYYITRMNNTCCTFHQRLNYLTVMYPCNNKSYMNVMMRCTPVILDLQRH